MTEAQLQSKCVIWFHNAFPEYRGLLFAINNNSEHVVRAMNRKSLGVVPGVADTCLILNGKAYFIEFKTEVGRQSAIQKEWQISIEKQGAYYCICRSFEQFTEIIYHLLLVAPGSRVAGMTYGKFINQFTNQMK